jgi:hypothetical protein
MNINDWEKITHFTELSKYPVLPCPHCAEIQLKIDLNNLAKRPMSEEALEKLNRETIAKKPKPEEPATSDEDILEKDTKETDAEQQYIPRKTNSPR